MIGNATKWAASSAMSGWRLLLPLGALYLAVRLPVLLLHELHNDEVIFMQFSQLMRQNWRDYWWLSVDGRAHGQYLAPLQYWIGALALRLFSDPIRLRAVSLLFGTVGFLSMVHLAEKIAGRRGALATGMLILVAPYFAMFDALYIGEVFAYALGAVFLLFAYLTLEQWWAGRFDPVRFAAAALAGGLALLAKESAAVFLVAGLPLAAISLAVRGGRVRDHLPRFVAALGVMAAAALLAVVIARLSIPAQFAAVRTNDLRYQMTGLSLEEVLRFPVALWLHNLRFQFETLRVGFNILPLLVPAAVWVWAVIRGKAGNSRAIAGWTLLMWLASTLPMILLLKTTYVRHHGLTLYLLCLLLGWLLSEVWNLGGWSRAFAGVAVLVAVFSTLGNFYRPLLQVGYTEIAAAETPKDWASGLGIFRMLEALEKLPPGVLLLDPQWGYPRTAAEVFRARYPQLELAKINPAALERIRQGKALSFLFETRGDARQWAKDLMNSRQLCKERIIFSRSWRGRELNSSQRVLCIAAPD